MANLSHATLRGKFVESNFTMANLSHTTLRGTFTEVNFTGANLSHAQLNGVFSEVDFTDVDFSSASFHGASLVNVTLKNARVSMDQLKQAHRMRGTILPDGTRYDGRFDCPGDREDALESGWNLGDPEDRATFYSLDRLRRKQA